MVGKVNLPPDAEKRKDVKGAAIGGPGLNAVDEESDPVEVYQRHKKKKEEKPARSPVRRRGR